MLTVMIGIVAAAIILDGVFSGAWALVLGVGVLLVVLRCMSRHDRECVRAQRAFREYWADRGTERSRRG